MHRIKSKVMGLLFAGAVVLLGGCATLKAPAPDAAAAVLQDRTPLILISIDGFRADYLERGLTPNIQALAQAGAKASMRPSFPSLTFPNHYTIVTGLRPDHHGVVGNTMRDPRRPGVTFKLSDATQVTDELWWDDATPFWVSAERVGVKTGTMFWPGSEAAIHGVRPSQWTKFNQNLPGAARVDHVLGWMDLPADERPEAYTLYFDTVDHEGHDHGTQSAELNASLVDVDASIGRLVEGLKSRGLYDRINIIIVADHGMADHKPETFIKLADLLPRDSYDLVTSGQVAGLNPKPGHEAEVTNALIKTRHDYMKCWPKAKLPKRFHFGTHGRIPAIVCLADVGGYIVAPSKDNWMPDAKGGSHGYDPYAPDMRALFIAQGPAIKPGVTLKPFDNVAIYGLMMTLLQLPPEPYDGRLKPFAPALKEYPH